MITQLLGAAALFAAGSTLPVNPDLGARDITPAAKAPDTLAAHCGRTCAVRPRCGRRCATFPRCGRRCATAPRCGHRCGRSCARNGA
ncbi:hypothetical protein [Mesoterricola sediminis]|uniref:Uncharacterized protein n=1 Tax=Mesoterricola sediminis TaxID=2927980 RepID=A0AA48H1I2_9BACT|nr:hypothetical protein [Mesoterricola sediminis]BDU75766.1 hypothetical protein METESE_07240 [Mesoterricola sediminis]